MEERIQEIGLALWDDIKKESKGLFDKNHWQGKLMDWVMKDPDFKVDLFHFVDLLPSLKSPQQVSDHIRQYLIKDGRELSGVMNLALKAATTDLTAGIASKAIRKNVTDLAKRFIVGETAEDSLSKIRKLHKQGYAITLDLLGEKTLSNEEGNVFQERYLKLIDTLADETETWKFSEHSNKFPQANVSVKISSLVPFLDCADQTGSVMRLKKMLFPIFNHAKERNVFLNVDLENWDLHEITYTVFEELVLDSSLQNYPHFGIVVQAYLKDSMEHTQRLLKLAQERSTPLTVRLVKGAYWDYEQVLAGLSGLDCPVWLNKPQTDSQYEKITDFLLDHPENFNAAFATHNLRSISYAIAAAEQRNIPKSQYEFQMLTGMAEPIKQGLLDANQHVRVYAPIGELLPGMAYLVRRLLENTSNSGFLKQGFDKQVNPRDLLKKPEPEDIEPQTNHHSSFLNCSSLDFRNSLKCNQLTEALQNLKTKLPFQVHASIPSSHTNKSAPINVICPSDKSICVSNVYYANSDDTESCIQQAWSSFPNWQKTTIEHRSALLNKLADILENNRYELAALMVYESAKPIREADADVVEAIDFCRYYAQNALEELTSVTQGNNAGETNVFQYQGRGPTAVIAPWNFPLAILCGMTTAALVAGNTVIMKPAEQSSAIARMLYDKMILAGIPDEVIHFLPGSGEEIGSNLVKHPFVANIAFTGSLEVGIKIQLQAAEIQPTQPQIKRVICEMGGKNAIIVDEDADYDDAISGVIQSAFAFAGQKCSACSRLIVVDPDGEQFAQLKARLVSSVSSMVIAPAWNSECNIGPVIDSNAFKKLSSIIATSDDESELLYSMELPDNLPSGNYVPPTIFEVTSPNHRLMQDEFFGPILTLIRCNTFEEAIDVANSTPFALTGGLYSRLPSHIEYAKQHFRVGNLYINRNCTGAIVGRQAFGGFGMSGGGTKAGGPGYLRQFSNPVVVTENTIRHGFTPELQV